MAAATKPPLKSSSHKSAAGAGAGKTIEEMYQKKTQLEHILLRPDTYVGSIEKHKQKLWVYEDGAMVYREVEYVPGLYKIFDEILVNAADSKQRDPSMDALRVTIDVEGCCISVYNNGDGVPVEIHQEEGIYVPELIFGHLLTSSNYDDDERKTTGGRNGYGAKLTNIFSTEFVIETADGRRQKKYKQVFSGNMGNKSKPEITKCKPGTIQTQAGRSGRLLAAEVPDTHDLSSGALCQGWKIDTKYYSSDLSIWTAHLEEGFSVSSLPHLDQLAALIMVFDMNDESSFLALQNWVENIDIQRFEVLLFLLTESADDELNYEFEYEVLSHAFDEQWEFVGESSTSRSLEGLDEAKAMQESTQQDVNGSADSSSSNPLPIDRSIESAEENPVTKVHTDSTGADTSEDQQTATLEVNKLLEDDHYCLDDLERLMSEIGNMRSNLRLVPDFQRREMAAKLAMKMAT
ncbi:hypothetical protein ACQ4PT_052454 [Festuca glaucescens]